MTKTKTKASNLLGARSEKTKNHPTPILATHAQPAPLQAVFQTWPMVNSNTMDPFPKLIDHLLLLGGREFRTTHLTYSSFTVLGSCFFFGWFCSHFYWGSAKKNSMFCATMPRVEMYAQYKSTSACIGDCPAPWGLRRNLPGCLRVAPFSAHLPKANRPFDKVLLLSPVWFPHFGWRQKMIACFFSKGKLSEWPSERNPRGSLGNVKVLRSCSMMLDACSTRYVLGILCFLLTCFCLVQKISATLLNFVVIRALSNFPFSGQAPSSCPLIGGPNQRGPSKGPVWAPPKLANLFPWKPPVS